MTTQLVIQIKHVAWASNQFHVLSYNHVYNYYVCHLNPKRCKIDKRSYDFGCWTIELNMNLLIFSTHVMRTHGN
jgi:hypothetical protein